MINQMSSGMFLVSLAASVIILLIDVSLFSTAGAMECVRLMREDLRDNPTVCLTDLARRLGFNNHSISDLSNGHIVIDYTGHDISLPDEETEC